MQHICEAEGEGDIMGQRLGCHRKDDWVYAKH